MKKIFLIILLFSFFNAYAEESSLIEIIKDDSSVDCRYTGKAKFSTENSGTLYNTNLCAKEYKAKTKDIQKAFSEFCKMNYYSNIIELLPDRLPAKSSKYRKDNKMIEFNIQENSALITVVMNNIDYNILFKQKENIVEIYDFTWFYSYYGFSNPGSEGKVEKINDKLSVVDLCGMYEGSNLTHTASGVTVRNVYSSGENISEIEYIVNTQDMDEAYKIIRNYVYINSESYAVDPKNAEQYFPKTLNENKGTKRISDDFVITELFIGVVDESTLYLLKEDGKIKGYAVVGGP